MPWQNILLALIMVPVGGTILGLLTVVIDGLVSDLDLGTTVKIWRKRRERRLRGATPNEQRHPKTTYIAIRILTLLLQSEEDRENIIGDLLEEHDQFYSKLHACLWLYQQVSKSALSLIYKNIKSRLAARLSDRIR